jgi:hypothetical protein
MHLKFFKGTRACSACDEIGSANAQHVMKFVPEMVKHRNSGVEGKEAKFFLKTCEGHIRI